MAQTPQPPTLDNVLQLLQSGALGFSPENRRKVSASVTKTAKVYGVPLTSIPADREAFARRWGRGRVTDYPLEHFRNAKAFAAWRSDVKSAISRALAEEKTPIKTEWEDLLEVYADVAGPRRYPELSLKARLSIRQVAGLAQAEGLSPDRLTTKDFVRWRQSRHTANDRASIARLAARFDRLRQYPEFAPFMPAQPVCPLPGARASNAAYAQHFSIASEMEALLSKMFGDEKRPDLDHIEARRIVRNKAPARSAVKWLIRSIECLHPGEINALNSIRSLLSEALILEALEAERSLTARSLQNYLHFLKRLCQHFDVQLKDQRLLKAMQGQNKLGKSQEAFCRYLLRSPEAQDTYFSMPKLLRVRAETALRRGEINNAIAAGTIAVTFAIRYIVSPIRTENTVELKLYGPEREIIMESGAQPDRLLVPGRLVKNGLTIESVFPRGVGFCNPRHMLDWFIRVIRPLMLARAGVDHSDWLLPAGSESGHVTVAIFRDWHKRETAAVGLTMRPHLVRHASASIMLDHDPNSIMHVAAFLADSSETVLSHYAFIDSLKRVQNAQKNLISAARAGRNGKRR